MLSILSSDGFFSSVSSGLWWARDHADLARHLGATTTASKLATMGLVECEAVPIALYRHNTV